MYKIFFKTNDGLIICECEKINYSYKDSCVHITDGIRSYKCGMGESEINSLLISGVKNGYILFEDKNFTIE